MRTPAGSECPFFYADFHRGRNKQECRLIAPAPGRRGWTPDLCAHCAVPRIRMANACPNLILEAEVASLPLGIGRRVRVFASCTRTLDPVAVPEIGCGLCHEHIFEPKPPDKAA